MSADVQLKLASQRALLGAVTPGLRSVSVEINGFIIRWRCCFDSVLSKEQEWEILSDAATEVIADFPAPYEIREDYFVDDKLAPVDNLSTFVYLRHGHAAQQGDAPEPATNANPASRPPTAPAR